MGIFVFYNLDDRGFFVLSTVEIKSRTFSGIKFESLLNIMINLSHDIV